MNSMLRKDCPMRHENGNCLPCGGFCTAVIDPICEAVHNAYGMGKWSAKSGYWEKDPNAIRDDGEIYDYHGGKEG